MQSVFSEDFCIGKSSQSGKLGFFPKKCRLFQGDVIHPFIYFHHNVPYKM